jgi:two-component system nitrate/nitrite response regulator NarL
MEAASTACSYGSTAQRTALVRAAQVVVPGHHNAAATEHGVSVVMHLHEDHEVIALHSEGMTMLRIFLVDDHLMLIEALAIRLATAEDLWVAGRCATDDPHLFEMAKRLRPDVITIEVAPLGVTIENVLLGLLHACPPARIVVVSADQDVGRAVQAARAGVQAWVPKQCGADELADVLRGVCLGHSWYPPELLGPILRQLRADVRRATDRSGPLDVLSPREREVLTSMVEGRRSRQIAEHLMISTDTVRTHTKSILNKFGVHSRLEVVGVARAAGLRPPEPLTVRSAPAISVVKPDPDEQ